MPPLWRGFLMKHVRFTGKNAIPQPVLVELGVLCVAP